jgi:hypothetical protein
MRGEIEILVGDETVYKDGNMIVDGAGSLLADVMTAPRAYADMPSASSILDASNYTIQAISFGKGKDGYLKNAHEVLLEKSRYFMSNNDPMIATTKEQSDVNDSTTSSIIWGVSSLPEAPNPIHSKLNLDCSVHSDFQLSSSYFGTEITALIQYTNAPEDFGQNMNLIPSGIYLKVSDVSSFVAASVSVPPFNLVPQVSSNIAALITNSIGCWPEGESEGGTPFFVFSSIEDNFTGPSTLFDGLNFSSGVYDASSGFFAQSGTLYGYFNEASSMDYSGYVNMIMSSVPNGSYSVSDSSGGLILSAASDFSSTGMIEYECTMASGDAVAAQLYGGIHNMGLWAMDVNSALRAGYTPPLSFDVINNQKRYKLFARKDLTKSLTAYQDTKGLTGSLTAHYPATKPAAEKVVIKWRLHFL